MRTGFLSTLFRLVGLETKRRKHTGHGAAFDEIWRQLNSVRRRYRPKLEQQDVLILQMGKVASLSLDAAIRAQGFNAFHCHSLSAGLRKRNLDQLFEGPFNDKLIVHTLRLHTFYVALRLLVRWYQRHKRRNGEKLKVITLTRDPVAWYTSMFVQRDWQFRPPILQWQRDRLGLPDGETVDAAQAVRDVQAELQSMIAAIGPLDDIEAAVAAARRLARERWPDHAIMESLVETCLTPLFWFDREIRDIFGIDLLSEPKLRKDGWVVVENDHARILALRFEELQSNILAVARFLGLSNLELPMTNVMRDNARLAPILAATQEAFASAPGRAFARSVRQSRYGRALGYDQAEQSSEAALSA